MPSSRGFSRPRDQTRSLASPALVGSFFTTAAPWEALMCRGHAHFGRASLVAQTVKSLSAVWEIRLRSLVGKIPWRRKWQPTPLPGESHGQRGLVGYSPRGRKESDTTERTHRFSAARCRRILYQTGRQGSQYCSSRHRKRDPRLPMFRGTTLRTQQAGPESSQEPHGARPRDLLLTAFPSR